MGFYQAKNYIMLFLAVLPVLCGALTPPGCFGSDGNYYNQGDAVTSTNPCEFDCICKGPGEIDCQVISCEMPGCENNITLEGSCCSVCRCEQDGVLYNPGDVMISNNPCEASCFCGNDGQRVCAMMSCMYCENPIYTEGQCCPRCVCQQNGQTYNAGDVVDHDPCHPCVCQSDGTIMCETIACPNITCKYRVHPKESCCPICQCMRSNKRYLPGQIVVNSTCKPQVCQADGSIKVEPVKCPDLQLECVDPVIPQGQCCPECPNGKTCAYGNTVIRYGEDKVIGTKICRCWGKPWFPNAFCTEKNVSARLLRSFGKYLAAYSP
ncbi:hypothetical protein ACJMK2_029891 [Sinanodonta woodiana]|uniref:VWFC domain-containing protein n=1 Tax=Sinanodonta woodiana TaxID=1069815 RepID=A0ABD3XBL6_SINWO